MGKYSPKRVCVCVCVCMCMCISGQPDCETAVWCMINQTDWMGQIWFLIVKRGRRSAQRGSEKWITPLRLCAFLNVFADVHTCAFLCTALRSPAPVCSRGQGSDKWNMKDEERGVALLKQPC